MTSDFSRFLGTIQSIVSSLIYLELEKQINSLIYSKIKHITYMPDYICLKKFFTVQISQLFTYHLFLFTYMTE